MKHIEGRSFIAEVSITTPGFSGPIGVSEATVSWARGWLVQGSAEQPPLRLQFDYLEHSTDRVLYDITGAPQAGEYAGVKLGMSRNGYLGFYREAPVTDFWKLQVVWYVDHTEHVDFIWRNHDGYQVSMHEQVFSRPGLTLPDTRVQTQRWLAAGVGSGTALQFLAKIERYV